MRRVTRKGTFVTMTSKRRKRVKRYVTIIAPTVTVKMTATDPKLFIALLLYSLLYSNNYKRDFDDVGCGL